MCAWAHVCPLTCWSRCAAQAESSQNPQSDIDEYVKGLDALLKEKQAALTTLQAQITLYKNTVGEA